MQIQGNRLVAKCLLAVLCIGFLLGFTACGSSEGQQDASITTLQFEDASVPLDKEAAQFRRVQKVLQEEITQFDGVDACIVSFSAGSGTVESVSVVLSLEKDKELTSDEEKGIRDLVAGSFTGIKEDTITIETQ